MARWNACEFCLPPYDEASAYTYTRQLHLAQMVLLCVHQKVLICHFPEARLFLILLLFLPAWLPKMAERQPDSRDCWPPCLNEFPKFAPSSCEKEHQVARG